MEKINLLIVDDRHTLEFFLISSENNNARVIEHITIEKAFTPTNPQEVVSYVLNLLSEWGKDIGWQLVQDTMPLVGIRGKRKGVDGIITISNSDENPLTILSSRSYCCKPKITQSAVRQYAKYFSSSRQVLFVNFDFDKLRIIQYTRSKDKALDVKQRAIDLEDYHKRVKSLLKSDYGKLLGQFKMFINLDINPNDYLYNIEKWPYSIPDSNIEFIMHFLLWLPYKESLYKLVKKQLEEIKISKGVIPAIVIGGEAFKKLKPNLRVFIASNLLKLRGIIKIYIDEYNLGNKVHYIEDCEDLNIINNLLYSRWGEIIRIESENTEEDIESSRAVLRDDNGQKKIIPLANKIICIPVHGKGSFEIDLGRNAYIHPDLTKIKITEVYNNLVLDQRKSSITKDQRFFVQNVIEWMSGLNVLKKS